MFLAGFLVTPVDTGLKLNVHKTFRRRPGSLLNILCTFNLRPVSDGTSSSSTKLLPSNQNHLCGKTEVFSQTLIKHSLAANCKGS